MATQIFEPESNNTDKVFEEATQIRAELFNDENKAKSILSAYSHEDLQNALQQACYRDLLEYEQSFEAADELQDILQLMAPYHMRKIARNSTKNLCEFVGVITTGAYEGVSQIDQAVRLPTPLTYNKDVKTTLASSFDWFDGRLSPFEQKLNCFVGKLRQWKNEIGDEPIDNGIIIGTILGALAGPAGAFVGGFFGNLFSDDSVKEEFEREFQFLLRDYIDMIEELKETLNDNLQLSLNSIVNYFQKIEELDHDSTGLKLLPK